MQTIERVSEQQRLGELDVQHVIHPLTNLHAHQTQGPIIWDRGEGINLYDAEWQTVHRRARRGCGTSTSAMAGKSWQRSRRRKWGGWSTPPRSVAPPIDRASSWRNASRSWRPVISNTILFTAGGSEVERQRVQAGPALLEAARAPQKRTIIGRLMGYHGLTLATTQATGIPRYWEMVDPGVDGFAHVSPPYTTAMAMG